MDFISKDGGLKLTLRQKSTQVITHPGGLREVKADQGLHVKFRPLAETIVTRAFPANDGMANGVLNSKSAARKARIDEDELISVLLTHPMRGTLFDAVGVDGQQITPERLHIIPSEGGGYYCMLCKKSLDSRGMHNHPKSKEHQGHLALIEQDAKEAIANA